MPGKLELHSRRRLHFNARVAIIPLKSAHKSRQRKTLSWFEGSGSGSGSGLGDQGPGIFGVRSIKAA